MQPPPIKIQQICDLKEIAYHENIPLYKFGKTVFQNSHIITIKQPNADGMNQFVIYDFQEHRIINKAPSPADQILVHENTQIVAFFKYDYQSTNIQIFNFEQKQKLYDKKFDIKINFWKFQKDLIIIVSETSVDYLDLNDLDKDMKQLFVKIPQFQQQNFQIMGIELDQDQNWFALKGLSPGNENKIEGHIQLYLKQKNMSQYVSGHACTFGKLKLLQNEYESLLIGFIQNQQIQQLSVLELNDPPEGFKWKKQAAIDNFENNDIPLFMHIFRKYGILMIITKNGVVQLYELTEYVMFFSQQITMGVVFAGIPDLEGDSYYLITNSGQVLKISLNHQSLTHHLVNKYNFDEKIINLAEKLSFKYNIPHYYEIQHDI